MTCWIAETELDNRVCHQSQNHSIPKSNETKIFFGSGDLEYGTLCWFCPESKIHEAPAKKVSIGPHDEAKNESFPQTFKNSTIRRALMRGFQIWSQYSNRITFFPLSWPTTVKILRILGKSEIP